ncbi:hypothetical protein AALO_G00189970 [Alosa alosa]|uniref:Prolactin receptor n=1 Tax=Alosa alosa TaxID=278164 RepID=A0AAV6GBW5_9TELE|nr:hypothetical protein AALO_G00189970 [Alosa alosa]
MSGPRYKGNRRGQTPLYPAVSMKSDQSMDHPMRFGEGDPTTDQPDSPIPSCVSMKSDQSMDHPMRFRGGDSTTDQGVTYPPKAIWPLS